jgi:predicted Holliday junction resolvase-like endonuclease
MVNKLEEDALVLNSPQSDAELEHEKLSWRTLILSTGVALLVLIIIAALVMLFITSHKLRETVSSQKSELILVTSKYEDLSTSYNKLSESVASSEDLKDRVENIGIDNYFSRLQHNVEGGVVTDDFVVEKFTVASVPPLKGIENSQGFLSTTIDLVTQPTANSKYVGQGKFSVTDRELKSMVLDVLEQIGKQYDQGINILYKDMGFIPWNKGEHTVTIKNYEVGVFKDGQFKLKGE